MTSAQTKAIGAAIGISVITLALLGWWVNGDKLVAGKIEEHGGLVLEYEVGEKRSVADGKGLIRRQLEEFENLDGYYLSDGQKQTFEVNLPGLHDPDRRDEVVEALDSSTTMTFRLVDDEAAAAFFKDRIDEQTDPTYKLRRMAGHMTLTHRDRQKLEEAFEGKVDDAHTIGYKFVPVYESADQEVVDRENSYWQSFYLSDEVLLSGDRLEDVSVEVDQRTQQPVLSMNFNDEGAETLERLTTEHVDRRFAISVGDEVQSAPLINEPIPGGRLQLSLGEMKSYDELQQEAQDLLVTFRSAMYPFAIELVDRQYVPKKQE